VTGVLSLIGVFGVAFRILVPTMAVHVMTAVAVHYQHPQEKCNPQPVCCEKFGHFYSFLLPQLLVGAMVGRIRCRYRIEMW